MALPDVCLAGDYSGAGGAAGGAGTDGAPSMGAGGASTSSASGWPFIKLTTKMRKLVTFQLFDTLCGGNPVDLTDVNRATFVAKEWETINEFYITKDMSITDPSEGTLAMTLVPDDLPYAGIWIAAVILYNVNDEIIGEYKCYLEVELGLTATEEEYQPNRPITIFEIRLALRDTCPEFNTLLEDLQFSDSEIAYSIRRPIDEWNETPPDLSAAGYSFTQNTFPWREHWRRAACGYLLEGAAYHEERNNLQYSAGGVSFNDSDSAPSYIKFAKSIREEWRNWMLTKKKEINMGLCYGSVRSISFSGGYYN